MAGKHIRKSGALAALAAGIAVAALPVAASAQENERGNRGGWQRDEGQRGEGQRGGWQRGEGQRSEGQRGGWQARERGGDRDGARDDARGGERGGSRWTGQQSAPATGQAAPQQGQPAPYIFGQGQPQRQAPGWSRSSNDPQRSYAAPDRNRTYEPRQQGWDGRRADRLSWDRNRDLRTAPPHRWDGNRGNSWSRDWRRDNRFGWQSYRNHHRDVFRMGRYYSPYRDWSYRRLGVGFFLQPLFFSQNYWIGDPWMYRLPPAYGPFRWVRYYDDALLVNIYNGEVADVIHDFFW